MPPVCVQLLGLVWHVQQMPGLPPFLLLSGTSVITIGSKLCEICLLLLCIGFVCNWVTGLLPAGRECPALQENLSLLACKTRPSESHTGAHQYALLTHSSAPGLCRRLD